MATKAIIIKHKRYIECECCGQVIPTRFKTNKKKYCRNCAKHLHVIKARLRARWCKK